MTGAYLRVKRNGKFENVEIEYLTDDERFELFNSKEHAMKWLNFLCNFIVENLYEECEEGNLKW